MDIKINADGTFDLSSGDINLLKDDGYIGQTIYSYLMEIPTDKFSKRAKSSSNEALALYIKMYLEQKLSNDPVINTSLIDVSVDTEYGGSAGTAVVINVKYNGTDLSEYAGYTTPTFSLVAGAVPLVDRNPTWLNYADYDKTITIPISYNVTIKKQTNRIEIPALPVLDQSNLVVDSVFPCSTISITNKALVGVGSFRSENITISVDTDRLVYPISKYLSSELRVGAETVSSCTITSSGATTSAIIAVKDGEICLLTKGNGVVSLSVTISPVGYISNSIFIDGDKEKDSVLYPLKPVRGKIYVVLPKTIKPASYVITYTAYKQRSIW